MEESQPALAEIGIPLALTILPLITSLSTLIGEGEDSSFDFLFSDRGGKKAVGDVLGVEPPFPDDIKTLLLVLSVDGTLDVRDVPRLFLEDPFLSLECTCECEKYIYRIKEKI